MSESIRVGMTRNELIAALGQPESQNTRTWAPHEYIVYYLAHVTYEITLKNGVVENIGQKPPIKTRT